MPTVGQPQIFNLPPPAPGIGASFGTGMGQGLSNISDLLLKALLAGQLQRQPTGGLYQSPTGQQTQVNLQPGLSEPMNMPTGGNFTPNQYGRYQLQPDLTRQVQQAQIKKDLAQAGAYQSGFINPLTGLPNFLGQPSANTSIPSTPDSSQPPSPSQTITEQHLTPTQLFPGQALAETGIRASERLGRVREVQKSLMDTYASRTATAAKAFGDSGNIAVQERKMMMESFPKDSDTYEGRVTKERSIFEFFDQKEAQLQQLLNEKPKMVLKGMSRLGPQYQIDPGDTAARKQAGADLQKLQAARVLYQQMYQEAATKIPPIGATLKEADQTDPNLAALQQQYPGAKIQRVK